jgi:sugar phosphate isomerase/epimerase
MASPIASLQLIVFGARNRDDFAGVLRDVAEAGYPAFEAGNLFETYGEETTRRLLQEYHLQVSGAHFGYGDYANPERLTAHIAYAKSLGVQNLMCSGVADTKNAEGYRQSARLFNEIGRRLADEGLTFHYHNHAWEFDDLGGVNGMEILSAETDPAVVKFNIDVFWVWFATKDPVDFIAKNAHRAGYFHFKDGLRETADDGITRPIFRELGRGEVDLRAAYVAAETVGASYIVAEQDHTELSPFEAIVISRDYLKSLGI